MKSRKIPAIMDNLNDMLDFILEVLEDTSVTSKYKNQIRLACEEALVNVIKYAYPDGDGDVEIERKIRKKENDLWIQILNKGVPYNPLLLEDPDINLAMEDRTIGGLGVYMYKSIMDEVDYVHKGNKNILTFSRKLGS